MKTGFIGLGNLGKAIAKRLISQDVELIVWNRTREKAQDLNVKISETPASLISEVSVLFINLFDSKAVQSVLSGNNGVLEGDCRGKIVIDTTTNHFEVVEEFYRLLKEREGFYLETPVLGSVVPASKGNLTVLVSGDKGAFDKTLPVIEKIGQNVFYVEEPTLASKMKLINNLVLGTLMATIAEAVVFGERAGLDKEKVIEILSAGAGSSLVLTAKKEKLLNEDFSTHFSSSLIYKDLHYLQDLARQMKRPVFTGSVAKELFSMTYQKKIDHLDFSGIYNVFRDL